MEAKEVVNLVQFYRHELLNQLQVIQGYMQIGNMEKTNANMNKLFESLHKERELLSLGIPNVFICIFKWNMAYQQFKISYSIDLENRNIADSDEYITKKLNQVMQDIKQKYKEEKVYQVHLAFKENKSSCIVDVSIDGEVIEQFEVFIS